MGKDEGERTRRMIVRLTVVLSVIFSTSFPSVALHFTQYLVYAWRSVS